MSLDSFRNILIICLCSIGCTDFTCKEIDFIKFEVGENPYVYIIEKVSQCTYRIGFNMPIDSNNFESEGVMIFSNNGYIFELENPNTNSFQLFDFKKIKGEKYWVEIKTNEDLSFNNYQINILIRDIVNIEKETIYVFELEQVFLYENHMYNYVIYISLNQGIIGSYITDPHYKELTIIAPRGNILADYYNFNPIDFRRFL